MKNTNNFIFKGIHIKICLIILIVNCCESPQPKFTLDEIPLIPLPRLVNKSEELLNVNKIQSIKIYDSDKILNPIGNHLRAFWEDHTSKELVIIHDDLDLNPTISLEIKNDLFSNDEAYTVKIGIDKIKITGKTAEGVYRGVKTLEQVLKLNDFNDNSNKLFLPGGEITDQPSYEYRGAMLDVSRHFFSVSDVKRYIDVLSIYKINYLHLHLSDDQGWRIEIKSWPMLTQIGGQTEVGGGKGGFYSQEDFREIVKYAKDHFITIVPEIDVPGHTNAALASYAELNCDDKVRELYTGMEVGFSSLCVQKEITYDFLDDVIREISEISPGPYFHIGGDESHVTSEQDFKSFINRVLPLIKKYNKIPMGWYELTKANISEQTLLQYWAKEEDFSKVNPKKSKILISAASYCYLDMKYDSITNLGLTWAGYLPIKKAYEWDPRNLVEKFDSKQIIGLEAPLWSETIENFDDISYMAFPRIIGYAEIGWTNDIQRDWKGYSNRLSFHGPLLESLKVKYYPTNEIDWK